MKNKKELRNILKDLNTKVISDDSVITCPVCNRGYLLEEEMDQIAEIGQCWACTIKEKQANNEADYAFEEHCDMVRNEVSEKDYVSGEEKRNYKDLPF